MYAVILVLSFIYAGVHGYSSGAPAGTCQGMTPAHSGIRPANGPAPYFFQLTRNTYGPGQTIGVTFQGNGALFKGFLIVAKNQRGQIVGSMQAAPVGGKILNCQRAGAITHTSGQPQAGINFLWTAPPDLTSGDIWFFATAVQSYRVFWINIPSQRMSPLAVTEPQTTTTTTTTTPEPPVVTSPRTTPAPKTAPPDTTTTTEATTEAQPTFAPTQAPGSLAMDGQCGATKGCFVKCAAGECDYVVSWEDGPTYTDFELTTKLATGGNQWIAIAFSKDLKMGDDEVLECVSDGVNVDVKRSINEGRSNLPLDKTDAKAGLSGASGKFNNGIFTCKFRRNKKESVTRSRRAATKPLLDLNEDWFLMFGTGPASDGFNKMIHRENPVVTPGKVDFQSLQVIGDTAKYPLIKVHAILMIIAWIFFTGVGIIAARYYKPVWATESILSQKVWFQIHRACMVTAFVLTIAGFIIIFVQVQGYSEIPSIPGKEFVQAHPPLGIIVTILTIINPIMSLFRPGPKDYNRPVFNWAHFGVGMLAHVLAIITICFGIEMKKTTTPKYAVWVVVGYVVYQILLEIALKTYDVCVDRPDTDRNGRVDAIAMTPTNSNGSASNPTTSTNGAAPYKTPPPAYSGHDLHRKDPRDTIVRKLLLAFHAAFALAFTITLCLLVAMY